jgi:hypothetical protein
MKPLLHTGLLLILAVILGTQDPQTGQIPDPHNHVVPVHKKPWNVDLAPQAKIALLDTLVKEPRDSVLSPNQRWLAFLFSVPDEWARVATQNMQTGKRYQLVGVPLAHRPMSDLVWIDSTLLAFDRWSQPHYGIHYVLDVHQNRLVLAVPFPDEIYLHQQHDTLR